MLIGINQNVIQRAAPPADELSYIVGISISNIVKMLNHLHGFSISAGGLVQGWQRLCRLLAGEYEKTGKLARTSAVLRTDETGWRKNGVTH